MNLINDTIAGVDKLEENIKNAPHGDALEDATYARDHIRAQLGELRKSVDALEGIVESADWPFPKYSEMLAPF